MSSFDALVLRRTPDGVAASVAPLTDDDLPEGEVLVDVRYSSLNYKDGLAITGQGKIIRGDYPFVPGIDLVGQVAASTSPAFAVGDWVIQTGWGLGEERWGGFSRRQRLRAAHLVPLPEGLAPLDAMTLGTAGLTAMLAVQALEAHGLAPGQGEVVVTGASGGVGSVAVALLALRGHAVVASTGKASAHAMLRALGAARFIGRDELGQGPRRPLDSARWAGAVDAVGGATLAALLSQLGRHASVASCGLAASHRLETTVFPFILRGVNLLGIDSNTAENEVRRAAWEGLATAFPPEACARLRAGVVPLADLPALSAEIVAGRVEGRYVVDVQAA